MIRSFVNTDSDYVVDTHYEIYHREHGYDLSFKQFVSDSVHNFIQHADRNTEHIWILDVEGEAKGSIGLTKVDDKTAQIRLFLIDPELRGQGYGHQLVQCAIDFARSRGYRDIILWTNSDLRSARHLYKKFGFELVEEKFSRKSNQDLTEERWSLEL